MRYYKSYVMIMHQAGFFVSAINPLAIKEHQDVITDRKAKTDIAEALEIARFSLDNWEIFPQYTPMDTIRYNPQNHASAVLTVKQDQDGP